MRRKPDLPGRFHDQHGVAAVPSASNLDHAGTGRQDHELQGVALRTAHVEARDGGCGGHAIIRSCHSAPRCRHVSQTFSSCSVCQVA